MPQLRVLFWNIQNFGDANNYRARQSRIFFIAKTVQATQTDILLIQEVTQNAIAGQYLQTLQFELNALPPPYNNWYYDWIKGALLRTGIPPAPTAPFNTAAELNWEQPAHYEGYAMFWNQNIAKFAMQAPPPIQPPLALAAVANTQSEQCRMQGRAGMPMMPAPGIAVPGGGLQVPGGGNPYVVPAGSTIGGVAVGVATPTAAGTVIPVGSAIGPGGITLNAQTLNVNPVVVPGGFTLTDAFTLPASGTVVVPQNALGLVMFGRDSSDPADVNRRPDRFIADISDTTVNYIAGGANFWNWIDFTGPAAGSAARTGTRRPAYATIKVNRPAHLAAADQLVPIIVYHAPSRSPASSGGMQRSAYSQPMFQAYDWTAAMGAGAWIDCNNALIGGDFNVVIDDVFYAYDAFTDPWGPAHGFGGGAAATMAIATPPAPLEDNPPNKSIVGLTHGIAGPPLWSANRDDFRQMAIDNIFYRGLAGGVVGANTALLDLMAGSWAGGALVGAPVANCLNTPNMVNLQHSVYVTHAPIALPSMVDPVTTLHEMEAAAFGTLIDFNAQDTRARRVAEFVNLFVSDHLPAAIRFDM